MPKKSTPRPKHIRGKIATTEYARMLLDKQEELGDIAVVSGKVTKVDKGITHFTLTIALRD